MGETTAISWCDHTWSPWYGCTQVSLGDKGACVGCYARQISEIRQKRVVFGGPGRGEGTRDFRPDDAWKEPLKWEREQARLWAEYEPLGARPRWDLAKPAPCFVFPSMCDPFDNHPALAAERIHFFDLIRRTPHLTWLLLTKRPGNILPLYREAAGLGRGDDVVDKDWPRNAAIGCTVVTQDEADSEIPKLLAAKAALNPAFAFVSMEPLMGPVDLRFLDLTDHGRDYLNALTGERRLDGDLIERRPPLDWVITGGETDQGSHRARPTDPEWYRALRDQCRAAGVPFHLKQMTRKGPVPADLQIQERPHVA